MKNNKKEGFVAIPLAQQRQELVRIAGGNPVEAEKALCAVASAQGDDRAVALISSLDFVTLAAIFSGHDASKPTIAFDLAKPKKVVGAMLVSPALWPPLSTMKEVTSVQESSLQLLLALFYDAGIDRVREILDEIKKVESAKIFLRFVFVGWNSEEEEWDGIKDLSNEADEDGVVQLAEQTIVYKDGTTGHLFGIIQEADVDFAQELLESSLESLEIGEAIVAKNMAEDLVLASRELSHLETIAASTAFSPLK